MEPRFKDQLDLMSHYAKDAEQDDLSDIEQEKLQKEIQDILKAFSEKRGSYRDDQERIFHIQQRKQQIMNWLHDNLGDLDKSKDGREKFNPNARGIVSREDNLFWNKSDGTFIPITEGMIVTDGVWGIDYSFDNKSVPRKVRKRYFIETARRLLENELDHQITIDQERSSKANVEINRGYHGLMSDRERVKLEGHMAERMVFSYMKKITIDNDVPFEMEAANVYEDIALKTDFIIKVKKRKRGVNVEETEDPKIVGIQFTIGKKLRGKKGQVDRAKLRAKEVGSSLEDIIIVKIPLKELRSLFLAWSVDKPPGGPDEMWDSATKEKLFKQMLRELFSSEEIDSMWKQIQPNQNPFK